MQMNVEKTKIMNGPEIIFLHSVSTKQISTLDLYNSKQPSPLQSMVDKKHPGNVEISTI
jgi:hypothetical protein